MEQETGGKSGLSRKRKASVGLPKPEAETIDIFENKV
jgi:hypothetical protein